MGQSGSNPEITDADVNNHDLVVKVEEVIARRGNIPVAGRYYTNRTLDQDFDVQHKVVGSGMSGPVQLATGKSDGQKYAVKSFKKAGLSARRRSELKSEVEIYISLDHPHIARLESVFETDEDIHLVMEFMEGGELYDRLAAIKVYSEERAAATAHQMLLAVAYLHAHQVAHRDLKLENFLYERKEDEHLKLIDFGFAKFWDRGARMSQACGSVHYVAPEVLRHCYTEKADMWSLGVITYMLLTGSPPFGGSDKEVLRKVMAGKPHYSTRFQKLSEPARKFVEALLVVDPDERLSAAAALENPWVKRRDFETETVIDSDILKSLRNFAHASHFRRAVLSMMAWSLSTEDRMELRKQFLALDTQSKGTITHQQLKHILEENFHVSSAEAETLFKSLDADNDDEIAYSEFLAAVLQGRVKVYEDVLRKTFHRFDRDQCGLITADDLREVLGEEFEGENIEDMIKEADTSGDGKIDYEEFLAYFHKTDQDSWHGSDSPSDPEEPAVARRHLRVLRTEKLSNVVDRLLDCALDEEDEQTGKEPSSPRPLARKPTKAKTVPASGSRIRGFESGEIGS